MKVMLDVPFSEKDLAKSKGAKWDAAIKSWYIDDMQKIQDFAPWLKSYNIICENLYILKKKHVCWKCKKKIDTVLLATDKSYAEHDDYKCNTNIQILTYVKIMPDKLVAYMKGELYTPSFSQQIQESYYINHCKYCKSIQGDNFLHEIPQQAFYSKLCYKSNDPISYAKINNTFAIRLQAEPPFYDEISSSQKMMLAHMQNGIENRASLHVNQSLINKLFDCSKKAADIQINGLYIT